MKQLGSLFACFALMVAAFSLAFAAEPVSAEKAPAVDAKKTYSVGQFAIGLADALKLQPSGKGAFTPRTASEALWKRGVRLNPDLSKPVKEEDLALALRQLGFELVTSTPGALVTEARARQAMATFVNESTARSLSGITPNPNDDFNNGNGKGGKFKRKSDKSPTETGD
jgi:hypothetical protein